ncbi:MAG: fused response regulator/phosphatase [Pirellulales bacterium]|nr:fused response regulator/phosphatase [Pirellulales bacterium]
MGIRSTRILLVEDDPDDVWIMRGLLGDRWDTPFELTQAEMLSVGLRHCARGGFDLILLDLMLPDSRGLKTFTDMAAGAGDVPIVVLTGETNEQLGVQAVQAGAQDYLVKGQLDDHLLIRSIRFAIERHQRRLAESALQITSAEFYAAAEIQRRLFPAAPPRVDGYQIAAALYPAAATAGDYFDYLCLPNGQIAVALGDVSGHGMGPALVMAETRAGLRALTETYSDVGEILTRANHVLAIGSAEANFVTLMLAALSSEPRQLTYAAAGQRGYLLDASGKATILDSTSPPLGIDDQLQVPAAEPIPLESGQIVALFTDGVVEAESPTGQRFGAARALDLIHHRRTAPGSEIIDALHQQITAFCPHSPPADDITIVLIHVL